MTAEEAERHGLFNFKNQQGMIDAIMLGRSNNLNRYIGYRGDGHTMIVAPPGGGKGQGFVLPNLCLYQGSMVVIDPKGENAAMTARHREQYLRQKVHVIDPFQLTGLPSAPFNPLAWLEHTEERFFFEDCNLLAQALVAAEADQYAHFQQEAENLMRGLILYLYAHEPDQLNLNRLFDIAFADLRYWTAVFEVMAQSTCSHPGIQRIVRHAGNWYLGLDSKSQKVHRGTIQKNLQWLAGLAVPPTVQKSDFHFQSLKSDATTVYLCIPGETRELYKPFVRCLVTLALLAMYRTRVPSEIPVQFMCDEFYTTIGTLPIVDAAVGDMRGYGARFAFVFQGLSQLRRLYPDTWENFESACGAVVYMGTANEDAEHLSKRLGMTEDIQQTGVVMPTVGEVFHRQAQRGMKPLLTPQEIKALGQERKAIILLQHLDPLMCDMVVSHADSNLSRFLAPNPMRPSAKTLPGQQNSGSLSQGRGSLPRVDDHLKSNGP